MSRSEDQTEPRTETDHRDTDDGTTRRRLLAGGAATWASVAVAGCPGDGGDGTATQTPTDEPTATETEVDETETETETPEPQPENFVVTTETWAGGEGVPASIGFMSACATTNTFVPGMQVVFFVGVFDPETGDKVGSDTLDGVSVSLDGGQSVDLSWSDEHGHATDGEGSNWVGSWTIPEDVETGGYSYTIEVSGGDGNFRNVGVLTDNIEIVEFDNPSNLVVDTETRWNGHPAPDYTNGFVGACAPERNYSSEMDVTFVVGVYDSTNGHMVGTDGLVQYAAEPPEDGLGVSDETSPYNGGIDAVTVTSPDGAFGDIELEWTDAADDAHGFPRWFGTLETENLDPGTYTYEVQVTDESSGRIDVGIAADNFTIIEVPSGI